MTPVQIVAIVSALAPSVELAMDYLEDLRRKGVITREDAEAAANLMRDRMNTSYARLMGAIKAEVDASVVNPQPA